jgi:replicative DNA helicase
MDTNERIPPHDDAAELSVLGSVLLAADKCLPLVGLLAVDDFFLPCHREAWAAILAVHGRQMPVDTISVGDELQARGMAARFEGGWMSWAGVVAGSVSTWHNVGHHAAVVRGRATLRRLITLAAEVQCAAYGVQPVDEVLALAREGVATLEVAGTEKGPEKIGGLLSGALEIISGRTKGTIPIGVPTGIAKLDDTLTMLKPGRLYILGGRPGDGKTALAACIALHAARAGIPSLFFSREMSNQELIERNLALVSRVPAYAIGSGRLQYDDWKSIQAAGNKIYEAKLWLDDRSSTLERITAEARKWHAVEVRGRAPAGERPLGLLVLDYLQLARVAKARPGANREQVVAEMSRAIKELAGELGIPALVLSQLNREAEKRGGRPINSDLRESGALEQDADVIMFVFRDIPPEDQKARRLSGPAEIIIGKHRGGPTGIVEVHFNTQLMQFTGLETYEPEPRPDWNTRGDFDK